MLLFKNGDLEIEQTEEGVNIKVKGEESFLQRDRIGRMEEALAHGRRYVDMRKEQEKFRGPSR